MKLRMIHQPTNQLFLGLIFRSLGTVFGTGLSSVGYACGIQCTSDDVVSGTGQVLHTAASDEYNAMLLKVVAFTRNVACYFDSVGKTYPGDFTKRGIRLLRCGSLDCGADTSLLGGRSIGSLFLQGVKSSLESRRGRFLYRSLSAFSYYLVKCRNSLFTS